MYIWTSPRWSPDLDCRRQQAWLYSLTCLPLGWGKASMLHSHSHKRHYGETLPPSPHSVQRQRKCNLFSRATPPAANTTAPTPRLSGAATGRKQNPKILQAESTGNHAEWHVQEDGKDLELVQIETPFLEMFLPFLGTLEIPVLLTTHTPYENSHYHRPPELATEHQMSSEETKASQPAFPTSNYGTNGVSALQLEPSRARRANFCTLHLRNSQEWELYN